MKFLQVGDAAIHYQADGLSDGRPIIALVNSLGTDLRIWDPVVAALGRHYAFLRHDKRGHGLSETGSAPASIETHAADVLALMAHLDIERVILWGLSIGGLVAQSIAVSHPERVRALILSNTAHKIGTAEMWNARIGAIKAEGLSPMVDPVMERWFTPAFRRADNPLYAGARTMLARQEVEGYCRSAAAVRDADFTEALRGVALPTLCIAGSGDGSTPPALVRELSALIPGSHYAEIDACGHIPCLEQPDAYAACVADFLTRLPEL
ncbi:3-oxoadipate enol-lactonase [Xaviernesmea oryzae]|uniref:3-oxoadipate enol-lactonase n=1 Tax=Xaviernesmea oryzae TaxID=464029 RepID=A0A1Q9B3I3_9HYPH|nr:3-oxoadipate enol-lactonase [Xaviernesmea oryzae]OLP62608.1 3-oxoadipate enol-lactonase [Xaviernesmea oryzae]SEM25989.1 3-oxoadipate enol-lactonase [Xaviernesmea oryzae]